MGVGSLQTKEYKHLCDMLKTARVEKGLTQQDVADKLGKPQSYVAKYERAERRLDVIEFILIVQAIGIKPEVLFEEVISFVGKRLS